MDAHIEAMLKALVAVAWTDGIFAKGETEALDAMIAAYDLPDAEANKIREYAKTPRALADVPLTELSRSDRVALFQHAVLMTHADGSQSEVERAMLSSLASKLRISDEERQDLFAAAEARASRLANLLAAKVE